MTTIQRRHLSLPSFPSNRSTRSSYLITLSLRRISPLTPCLNIANRFYYHSVADTGFSKGGGGLNGGGTNGRITTAHCHRPCWWLPPLLGKGRLPPPPPFPNSATIILLFCGTVSHLIYVTLLITSLLYLY